MAEGKAFPDFEIFEARGRYHGLFIEYKRTNQRLKKRNGEWYSEHIKEQHIRLLELRKRGYAAVFISTPERFFRYLEAYLMLDKP